MTEWNWKTSLPFGASNLTKNISLWRAEFRRGYAHLVIVRSNSNPCFPPDAAKSTFARVAVNFKVREYTQGFAEPLTVYRISLPVQSVQATTHESDTHTDNLIRGGHERP